MIIEIYPPLSIYEIGQRDNQEDAIAQWKNRLFVLCDGMGGHEKGEVASQTVCQALVEWFSAHVNIEEPFLDEQLCEALEYAYQQLDEYRSDSPKQMGTTLTLLYIHKHGVTAAHIGDSRIYHLRFDVGQTVLYESRDHSLAFDLFQSGEISYEEMLNFPQKNIITRVMTPGKENRMRPDVVHISDIKSDDWLCLCSDGMEEQINTMGLGHFLRGSHYEEDEIKRDRLIAATSNNQDNHSAWLIHIKDVTREDGDELLVNEEPTSRCNVINIIQERIKETNDDVTIIKEAPKRSSFFERLHNLFN